MVAPQKGKNSNRRHQRSAPMTRRTINITRAKRKARRPLIRRFFLSLGLIFATHPAGTEVSLFKMSLPTQFNHGHYFAVRIAGSIQIKLSHLGSISLEKPISGSAGWLPLRSSARKSRPHYPELVVHSWRQESAECPAGGPAN